MINDYTYIHMPIYTCYCYVVYTVTAPLTVQASLKERCDAIVASLTDEMNSVAKMITDHCHAPPQHKNMPPVTSKLCWLHALRERITWPMDKLREVAAELLEGDKGWSLRHIHNQLLQEIEQLVHDNALYAVCAWCGLQLLSSYAHNCIIYKYHYHSAIFTMSYCIKH